MDDLEVSETVTIPGSDLDWTAVRASGSGGQNVNKVATKIDLRFDLRGTAALLPGTKARLRALAGPRRLDAAGRVIILSQATRQRERNIEDARMKLRELIRRALAPRKRRRPTKPSRAAKRRRLDAKRMRSDKKRDRGKVDRDA